jgi:hypothetical protein
VNRDPFAALGLAARPDLTDEEVRAAWRAIAAATHPDRADGGDPARYAAASAAYAELRSAWGRSEAWADLAEQAGPGIGEEPDTAPLPAVPAGPPDAPRPGHPLAWLRQLPSRVRCGRPLRLLIRGAIAAAGALAVLALIPGRPAVPADIAGLVIWFVLTGRRDLAPPPER